MQRSGAQLITDFLEQRGVRVVAGMPGGANLPMYDALQASSIRHVLVRHEQAAGFIAQGIARVTGRAGVCFATSGPGATNLVTPLADARMDSVPVVAITGQVPTSLIGTDAFQEVDAVSIFRPVVKQSCCSTTVTSASCVSSRRCSTARACTRARSRNTRTLSQWPAASAWRRVPGIQRPIMFRRCNSCFRSADRA
jgi:thiamine pyrophosphate-dependent acetolactate synthase large subunit-like protein